MAVVILLSLSREFSLTLPIMDPLFSGYYFLLCFSWSTLLSGSLRKGSFIRYYMYENVILSLYLMNHWAWYRILSTKSSLLRFLRASLQVFQVPVLLMRGRMLFWFYFLYIMFISPERSFFLDILKLYNKVFCYGSLSLLGI